jgi:hypothetical protein
MRIKWTVLGVLASLAFGFSLPSQAADGGVTKIDLPGRTARRC